MDKKTLSGSSNSARGVPLAGSETGPSSANIDLETSGEDSFPPENSAEIKLERKVPPEMVQKHLRHPENPAAVRTGANLDDGTFKSAAGFNGFVGDWHKSKVDEEEKDQQQAQKSKLYAMASDDEGPVEVERRDPLSFIPGNNRFDQFYGMAISKSSDSVDTLSQDDVLNVELEDGGEPTISMLTKRQLRDQEFPEHLEDAKDATKTVFFDHPNVKVESTLADARPQTNDFQPERRSSFSGSDSPREEAWSGREKSLSATDLDDQPPPFAASSVSQTSSSNSITYVFVSDEDRSRLEQDGVMTDDTDTNETPNHIQEMISMIRDPSRYRDEPLDELAEEELVISDEYVSLDTVEPHTDKGAGSPVEESPRTRAKKSVSWSDISGQSLLVGPSGSMDAFGFQGSPLKPIIKLREEDGPKRPEFLGLNDSISVKKHAGLGLGHSQSIPAIRYSIDDNHLGRRDPPYKPTSTSVYKANISQQLSSLKSSIDDLLGRDTASPSPSGSLEALDTYQQESMLRDLRSLVRERNKVVEQLNAHSAEPELSEETYARLSETAQTHLREYRAQMLKCLKRLEDRIGEILELNLLPHL